MGFAQPNKMGLLLMCDNWQQSKRLSFVVSGFTCNEIHAMLHCCQRLPSCSESSISTSCTYGVTGVTCHYTSYAHFCSHGQTGCSTSDWLAQGEGRGVVGPLGAVPHPGGCDEEDGAWKPPCACPCCLTARRRCSCSVHRQVCLCHSCVRRADRSL